MREVLREGDGGAIRQRRSGALHEAIARRHTNRGPYDISRRVPREVLGRMAALGAEIAEVKVLWVDGEPGQRRVGELIVAASEAIVADRQQSGDSARWFRSSWQELQRRRDGITLDAQSLPPFINAVAKILPPGSQERPTRPGCRPRGSATLRRPRPSDCSPCPMRGTMQCASAGAGCGSACISGRRRPRGLAIQPLNQPSERADRETQLGLEPKFGHALKELIGGPGLQALMPFRVGYPLTDAGVSPRRDVRSVVVVELGQQLVNRRPSGIALD